MLKNLAWRNLVSVAEFWHRGVGQQYCLTFAEPRLGRERVCPTNDARSGRCAAPEKAHSTSANGNEGRSNRLQLRAVGRGTRVGPSSAPRKGCRKPGRPVCGM